MNLENMRRKSREKPLCSKGRLLHVTEPAQMLSFKKYGDVEIYSKSYR
jgi:hypothetical protein